MAKNKSKNASKILKNVTLLDDADLTTILNSLQKSRNSIRMKMDSLGSLIGQETKIKMYNDMHKYTRLINKINGTDI